MKKLLSLKTMKKNKLFLIKIELGTVILFEICYFERRFTVNLFQLGVTVLKHKIFFVLLIIVTLILLIPLRPVFTGSNELPPQSDIQMPFGNDFVMPGSTSYNWYIKSYAMRYGNKSALARIMNDVDKYSGQIGRNTYTDNLRLYKTVSYYISKIGSVDMQTHYFRNKLNLAPNTLEELHLLNQRMPPERRWKLVPLKGSLFHLQGPDGIYNLKFVSPDKFCEAVYNRQGILLTEKNDPINMGTFNYAAGMQQKNAHEKYDVTPYLKWGNSPDSPQKGRNAIQKGVNAAYFLYNQNISDVHAFRHKFT